MLCTYSPCLFPPHIGPVAIMLLPLLCSSSSLSESCYILPRPFLYVVVSSGFPLAVRPSQTKLLPQFIRQSHLLLLVQTPRYTIGSFHSKVRASLMLINHSCSVLRLLFSIHAHTLFTSHKASTTQSHHILLITMFPQHTPQLSTSDSPSRRGSVPTMSLVPLPESPSRRLSIPTLPIAVPTNAMTSTPLARDYLPFHFGTEFELLIRPKNIANLEQGLQIPEFDALVRAGPPIQPCSPPSRCEPAFWSRYALQRILPGLVCPSRLL
jgi:hypothetical protein